MTDYRAVMKLLVQQRSYRQIEQQLGCSHRAISRSNQVLRSLGIRTLDHILALTDDELDELFVDGRSTGQGEFVPIDFDAVVKARTGRNKQTLQVLWGALHHHTCFTRPAPLQLRPVSPVGGVSCRCGRFDRTHHPHTGAHHAGGLGRHQDAPVRPLWRTGGEGQRVCRLNAVFRDDFCPRMSG